MPTATKPHDGGSASGRLGALKGGVTAPNDSEAPNGGTSAQSKHEATGGQYLCSQHQRRSQQRYLVAIPLAGRSAANGTHYQWVDNEVPAVHQVTSGAISAPT